MGWGKSSIDKRERSGRNEDSEKAGAADILLSHLLVHARYDDYGSWGLGRLSWLIILIITSIWTLNMSISHVSTYAMQMMLWCHWR